MERTAVHFGAGALGRGLVLPRLVGAGWSVVVVDPLPEVVAALRHNGGYPLEMNGKGALRRLWIPVAAALHPVQDREAIAAQLAVAPLVTSAVRKENLTVMISQLAAAWATAMPNIVALVGCENVERVDEVVGAILAATELPLQRQARVLIPRTVVDRICASDWPASMAIRTETYTELAVSPTGLDLPGIDVVHDIDAAFDRKRYLVNTLADAAAILGLGKGYTLLSQACSDQSLLHELAPLLDALKRNLALLHGFAATDLDSYADVSRLRLADTFIPRQLDTVARDLWRKMQPGERFFAPVIDLERRGASNSEALVVLARLVRIVARIEGTGDDDVIAKLHGLGRGDEATRAVYVAVAAHLAAQVPHRL